MTHCNAHPTEPEPTCNVCNGSDPDRPNYLSVPRHAYPNWKAVIADPEYKPRALTLEMLEQSLERMQSQLHASPPPFLCILTPKQYADEIARRQEETP